MTSIVTFGEIMGRMTPPGYLRLKQSLPGTLEVTFAGAEANVAASLAMFGADAKFVTALPNNDLADACISTLQATGVASHIVRTDYGRLGLYFVEKGANQRPSRVTYDREHSAISLTEATVYDWQEIFAGASWFHVTGITPAVSRYAADATIAAVRAAKEFGLTVSCDLNFRGKLWRWDGETPTRELAQRTMTQVLPSVDVLIANEEDCGDVLGIRDAATNVHAGQLDVDRYPDVARQVVSQFPNIGVVATTLRQSLSASHNNWGAMLYATQGDTAVFSPRDADGYQPYEIRNIVDRVGGGDAFAAGLIYGLTCPDYISLEESLDFAVAASCLAHSIEGDFNFSDRAEVDALAKGSSSGRVVR
ncbi:MAG: PfkB family carbohydrate kinase [Rubripirellula sp.]